MVYSRLRRVLPVVAGIIAGLALGLGYGQIQAKSLQKGHQIKIKEINQRLSQTQRKVSEEKALQASLEQEKQGVQEEVAKLTKEKGQYIVQRDELKAKAGSLEAKTASSEAKTASLEKRNSVMEAAAASLEAKVAALEKKGASLEAKNGQLTERIAKVEAERNTTNQKYDQCAVNNARLYVIAEELIERYENRGFVSGLLEKEPLTQIKRVELERLVQDYKDKIDQQKVRSK